METGTMTEFPLVYPCNESGRRRFTVNDSDGTVSETAINEGHSSSYDAHVELERFRGSASVSALQFGDQEAVMTTSALVDEPQVVAVILSWRRGLIENSMAVELDIGREMDKFSRPVKTKCFAEDGVVFVVMVDNKVNILSLGLDLETLTPLQSSVKICSVLGMLENRIEGGEEIDTETDVHSTMIAYLSSTVLLVAVSPLLLAVDIDSANISVWSEIQCQEEMRNRGYVFSNILSAAGNMFLGSGDEKYIDMPPTAALCAVWKDARKFDVFSLHSDASLRRWRVDLSSSVLPFAVTRLHFLAQDNVIGKPTIPPPSVWSHSVNAVSLCARFYESIFALAIHVQTDDTSISSGKSGCCLTVAHGPQDIGANLESSLDLSIPDKASNLVGMDFFPNRNRCSLLAVFQTTPQTPAARSGTVCATYAPSIMSIVSRQPILTPTESTLDGVAREERDRLGSLTFEIRNTAASIQEDLHELDARYMKFLFRPFYPRGSGTVVAPSVGSIKRAIRKLVPGFSRDSDDTMSIQLETLHAMHQWRTMESRSGVISSPPVQSGGSTQRASSVYHSFVAVENERQGSQLSVYDGYVIDQRETQREENTRSFQIATHQKRWKKLLVAVWEEERVLRSPLSLSSFLLVNGPEILLSRVGVISALSVKPGFAPETKAPEPDAWDALDEAAIASLTRVEENKDMRKRLSSIESEILDIISRAQLVLPSPSSEESLHNAIRELCDLGDWSLDNALHQSDDTVPSTSRTYLSEFIQTVQADALSRWVAQVPPLGSSASRLIPGLSLLSETDDGIGTNDLRTNTIPQASTRHAASSLCVRGIDSFRRLRLARCLLLFGIRTHADSSGWPIRDPTHQGAFTAYLHIMSVRWVHSQLVAAPRTKNFKGKDGLICNQPKSGVSDKTTALDAHLIHLSQLMELSGSPLDVAVLLARAAILSSLELEASRPEGTNLKKVAMVLPELRALPPPAHDNLVSDYPRLALRLLSPLIAFAPARESVIIHRARREAAAECLLIESYEASRRGAINETQKREAVQKACVLLLSSSDTSVKASAAELARIGEAFDFLRSRAEHSSNGEHRDENSLESRLCEKLREFEEFPVSFTAVDVSRLCRNQTAKSLLWPLVLELDLDALDEEVVTKGGIQMLLVALLRVSGLIHRLSVLERHLISTVGRIATSTWSLSALLVEYIENAISTVSRILPRSVYVTMPEYAALWTMLSRSAVVGQQWRKAFEACLNNPIFKRKVKDFEKLVITMADSGFLGDLLEFCFATNGSVSRQSSLESDGECIELYELATGTLVDFARNAVHVGFTDTTDYGGLLYALHACLGHWRRAAQAMAFRYRLVKTYVATSTLVQAGAVFEKLSLATLGALHSLIITRNPSQTLIMAGDSSAHTNVSLLGSSNLRWGKHSEVDKPNVAFNTFLESEIRGEAQSPHALTVASLARQFVRAMALHVLSLDSSYAPLANSTSNFESVDDSYARFASRVVLDGSSADVDREVIDTLSSLGYFRHALLLAETMRGTYVELCGGQPNGRDQVYDSLCYIMQSYLVPAAVPSSRALPPSTAASDVECQSRPTCSQLANSFNGISNLPTLPSHALRESWGRAHGVLASTKEAAAIALIRKLVVTHTSPVSPIALVVAGYILDCDTQLPNWLRRFLMGVDGIEDECWTKHDSGHHFSAESMQVSHVGDPTGLTRLYVERDMYVDACNFVSSVLSTRARDARASTRIPEKGDIEFVVPFGVIDVLWNRVDSMLGSPSIDASVKIQMEAAKAGLEKALEEHLELVKISEMGLQSARVLDQ